MYSGFPREAYFALAEEALRQDLPLTGHTGIVIINNTKCGMLTFKGEELAAL